MKARWGIHVCTCRGTLPVDAAALGAAVGPQAFLHVADDPLAGAQAFARAAREQGLERVLVSCCQGAEPCRLALAEQQRFPPLHEVALKARAYQPHPDAAQANRKAARLLRAALRAGEKRQPQQEVPLFVGKRVLLVTDSAAGLNLAESLAELGSLQVVVAENVPLPPEFPSRRALRGRLAGGGLPAVHGSVGKFVTLIQAAGNGTSGGANTQARERELESDQVVLALQQAPRLRLRTGLHVPGADVQSLAAVPAAVKALQGEFLKPVQVRYDPAVCAGGASGMQACGRCIPACPYQAVARDSANALRIAVDQLACEGCGACVAACPTAALTFTDPAPEEVYAQLAGLLADLPAGVTEGLQAGLGAAHGSPPPIIAYHCSNQGRQTLDAAAEQGWPYAPGVLPVEVPCLRHVSEAMLLAPLRMGAGGVALLGCEDCPHGERELMQRNLRFASGVLDGFGLGGRLRVITAQDSTRREALAELDRFAQAAQPTGVTFQAQRYYLTASHDVVADTIATLWEQVAHPPGAVAADGAPYARAEVRAAGCTLCRSCANVCPSHAFRFEEREQRLELKVAACVACGMCEPVCPEKVIRLVPELPLQPSALDYQTVAQDEMIACHKCGKPYINRRALERIEAKVLHLPSLGETFKGARGNLLRMCPDCRAAIAVLEMQKGWVP